MSRVILDADMKNKLGGLREQMELCDLDGRTMGRYLPEEIYQKFLYQLAESQCPALSAEEIERRRSHRGPGKSLAEIVKRLEAP
jgi:hypothetical protein